MTRAEALRIRAIVEQAAESLDDQTVSTAPTLLRKLKQDGKLVSAGTRINWCGTIKLAAVDLWDIEENNPDNAPALWQEIEYRNGIRVIPAAIPATDPFKLGDYGWWGNDLYRSAYNGDNVWTPEGYPAAWQKINL